MDVEELAIRQRLKDDFPHYAAKCLKIRTKAGTVEALVLNDAQAFLHAELESQLATTGRIRALIVKGRQQGCSTYVEGRFYHKVTHRRGVRAYILTHLDETTAALFEMTKRYQEHCPEVVRPHTRASNARELVFDLLDSAYKVGTAGSRGAGLGQTIQYFHGCLGSETLMICGRTGSLRPIGEFSVGDRVVTHTGADAVISAISTQRKPVMSVVVKGLRDFPFTATGKHRFWGVDGWRELSTLMSGDCIGFPVRTICNHILSFPFAVPAMLRSQGGGTVECVPNRIAVSYELGRVVGLYLAEGCLKRQYKSYQQLCAVTFAVHEREVPRTVEWLESVGVIGRSIRVSPRKDSKTVTVNVYGRAFPEFLLSLCGEKDTKRFPCGWQDMGRDFVAGLVHGYLAGDGHFSPTDRRISLTSVRSATVIGLRDALASLGYGWATIEHKNAGIRHGRSEREAWTLRLTGFGVETISTELDKPFLARKRPDCGNYGTIQVRDGYAWLPIVSIEDGGIQEVVDFEIDHQDHSYCILQGATHNSEVAYWPNADRHIAGVLQAIPNAPGTEIILESTSAGPDGVFYEMWQAAVAGKSNYIPIFIPWFWQDEYREPVPEVFTRTEEEDVVARAYGLDDEQLQWRRGKIVECGSEINFKREYPFTAEEAFALGPDTFFECWTPRTHTGTPWHVIPTGPVPEQCNYVMGMDWGFNDPCAIHLIAVWPDGRLNVCRELYQRKRETRDLAMDLMRLCLSNGLAKGSLKDDALDDDALIEAVNRGKVRLDHIQVFAGHDMFNRRLRSDGTYDQPIADIMRDLWGDYGPILVSSGRDPLNRAVAWRDYLGDWGSDEGWPDGRPGIQVMECCTELIRTIPLLRSDPKNPEVVDTTMDDHAYDACGHCLTSLPERPAKPKRPEEPLGRRKPVKKAPTHDIYDQVGWM